MNCEVSVWLFAWWLLLEGCAGNTVAPCPRASDHAQPADEHFRLGVAGDPDLFLPGELYTVSLQGVDSGQGPKPFTGFTIWAEPYEDTTATSEPTQSSVLIGQSADSISQSLGAFQAYDAQAKLHEYCTPAVDNATSHTKVEIQVIWSAPLVATSVCVRICARVQDARMDALCRPLCPAPATPARALTPPIVEPCCACDEAKYEVTFEGVWSRNTHPRSFPTSARAYFGDVIGATHTAQHRVWQEGRQASAGLRRLADDGAATALEKELKAESDHIRTIIKARGISPQQVAAAGGSTPSTFAVFRVDAKHHLVSLAAKLAPSPDWFLGVSALELCNANCTWTQALTLPLFPYDAGTDSGLTYTSRRQPTVPAAPVRALRPDWPRDVRSPFYNAQGEMRPFARLKLNRLRLYEKSCDTGESGSSAEHSVGEVGGACAVHTWGEWGSCSVTCGQGRTLRQRNYVWPARAVAEACRVPLTQRQRCYGPRMHCRAISDYEPDPAVPTGPCAVSPWSDWSPCMGCGLRVRTRHYVLPRAHKRCHVGYRANTIMSQAMPCDAGPCYKPPEFANSTNYDWFFVDKSRPHCPTTAWGEWSPCNVRCGRGQRLRTRIYVTRDHDVQVEITRRLLDVWNRLFSGEIADEAEKANMTSGDEKLDKKVSEHMQSCQFTLTVNTALCDGEDGHCPNATVPPEVCQLPLSVGHCRGYSERWFHDYHTRLCEPMGYTGCGGNANNFRTYTACRIACPLPSVNVSTASPPTSSTSRLKNKTRASAEDNEVMQGDAPGLPITDADADCAVSTWLGWSECFGSCQYGFQLNYRRIISLPSGTGQQCPALIKSRDCKPRSCRPLL